MPLSLFGYRPQSRVEDNIGAKCEFDHTFGGRTSDFDLLISNAPKSLHLIYRLDLRDPLIPIHCPNIDFLPLLYCFNYGTECCYEMISNSEIKLWYPKSPEHYYPPWEAPASFPTRSTSFSRKRYDPTNATDVMNWKGVFGWDGLSNHERVRALDLARTQSSWSIGDAPDDSWSYEDVIRNMFDPPFTQSKPYNSCENPDCSNEQLRVIALQDRVVSSELIWPDQNVLTIWEMCQACSCITVSNQCG